MESLRQAPGVIFFGVMCLFQAGFTVLGQHLAERNINRWDGWQWLWADHGRHDVAV